MGLFALGGASACLAAAPALAQDTYNYFGLGAGRSGASLDQGRLARGYNGTGLAISGTSSDDRGSAYKLFFGRQFDRNFGLELGYFDLGKFDASLTTVPAGSFTSRIASRGVNLDLVGTLPLTTNFALLGRVGVQYAKTSDRYSSSGAVTAFSGGASERKAGPKAGLGMQYAFSPGFMLRAEAERYRVTDPLVGRTNVSVASVSLVFPLGRTGDAPMRTAAYVEPTYVAPPPAPPPPPVIVAQAPPPPPVVVVTPPQPVVMAPTSRRVSFSSESLFGFDRAELRADGRAALDVFVGEIAGLRFDTMAVEGHTDRLGSTAYNERLSMQRAEAVKSYLVSNGRVDGLKVSTSGKGETQPVTKAEDCKGSRATAQLIACLQPDRRVDVEVSGLR